MYFLEAFLVLIALCFITFWVIVTVVYEKNRIHCEAIRQCEAMTQTNLYNTNLYKITRSDGRTEIIKLDFNPGDKF